MVFFSHLLAIDVSLEKARVVRVGGDFCLHDSGCDVIVLVARNSSRRGGSGGRLAGEEVVGSEDRNPGGCEEGGVVRRENQILRSHEWLVGVVRHSVHFIHDGDTKRNAAFLCLVPYQNFWNFSASAASARDS